MLLWCIYQIFVFAVLGLTSPVGNCSAGYFCTLGAVDQSPVGQLYGDVCPSGHYCPEGTGTPEPCPAGTYLPDSGRRSQLDCLPCPGGKFCAREGLANYTGTLDVVWEMTDIFHITFLPRWHFGTQTKNTANHHHLLFQIFIHAYFLLSKLFYFD